MNVYYGPRNEGMIEIYRDMQRQARTWQRAWDRVVSRVRKPGYGNHEGPGLGTARHDLTLATPALPDPATLAFEPAFSTKYKSLAAEAPGLSLRNNQLQHALIANMARASRNHYNLEVLLTLARFTGHHWNLVSAVVGAEGELVKASAAATQRNATAAVGHLVAAHNRIAGIETESAAMRRYLTRVWERSQYPKGRTVDGRKFVHILDDTKDHWADRTPDLGYMFHPEKSIGLGEWRLRLKGITESYAKLHGQSSAGLIEPQVEP